MPDLEAVRAEFEAAEERGRAETARDGERVRGLELDTALGDEAGCVGLGGDVVFELDRDWAELGLDAEVWVPLHGREQALGIIPGQLREGGEAGRDTAE